MGNRQPWGKRGWYRIRDGYYAKRLPDGRELHVTRRKWTWIDSNGAEHKTMTGAMVASEQGGTDGQ